MAFIDESYQAPGPSTGDGFYTVTGALVDRDRMIDVRKALLKVTGGKPWHTNEAAIDTPAVIHRMTTAIAAEAENNTLVVSTPWTEGTAARHRAEALDVLLVDLSRMGARVVIMDSMEHVAQQRDQRVVKALRSRGLVDDRMLVAHGDDTKEALLWVPDTVGWAVRRLLTANEAEWSEKLEDVVAVKESQQGGWIDLAAVRQSAGEPGARTELEKQVGQIRGTAFPRQPKPTRPAAPAVQRPTPGSNRQNEGPAR